MAVEWNRHRFSGGALALDVANTVVHRAKPEQRFDRFEDAAEIARFAAAAAAFRSDEFGGRVLAVADGPALRPVVLALREAADRLFRLAAASPEPSPSNASGDALPALLEACASALRGHDIAIPFNSDRPQAPLAFEAALAVSALGLLAGGKARRVRICPNCDWLFLDRSRNGSRLWCDMAVCGNRNKARRHYRRRRAPNEREVGHG